EAAVETYDAIRSSTPAKLTLSMRQQLEAMAKQIGQVEFAAKLAVDAYQDFRTESAKQWVMKAAATLPQGEAASSIGKNGLAYLKLAIVTFKSDLDAEIRGPAKHPFGYGFTLKAGQVRRETWPVGSRLTEAGSGRLIHLVSAEDAGTIVVISQ
ncbi:MAG: hypothetical protein AAGJ83_12635, partial [Planctomycetota bacterium]